MLYYVICREFPYSARSLPELTAMYQRKQPIPENRLRGSLKPIIVSMLVIDPQKRANAADILKMDCFDSYWNEYPQLQKFDAAKMIKEAKVNYELEKFAPEMLQMYLSGRKISEIMRVINQRFEPEVAG